MKILNLNGNIIILDGLQAASRLILDGDMIFLTLYYKGESNPRKIQFQSEEDLDEALLELNNALMQSNDE